MQTPPWLDNAWLKFKALLWEVALPWWKSFGDVLGRIVQVLKRPTLVLYASMCILMGGGAGTWLTFAFHQSKAATARDVILSAATYVLAVTGTGLADMLIDRDRLDSAPLKLFLGLFGILSCIPVGRAVLHLILQPAPAVGAAPQVVSASELAWWTLPCFFVWMLVNVRDPRFHDDPQAAAGGNPLGPL